MDLFKVLKANPYHDAQGRFTNRSTAADHQLKKLLHGTGQKKPATVVDSPTLLTGNWNLK